MLITPVRMLNYSYSRKNCAKNNYQTNLINSTCSDSVSFNAKPPVFTVNRELLHTRDVCIEDLPKFFEQLFNRRKQTTLREKESKALKALHDKIMTIAKEELAKTGQNKGILAIVNRDARLNIREARYVIGSNKLHIFGGKSYDPISLHFKDGQITRMENVERTIEFKTDNNRTIMTDQRDTAW